MHNNNELQEYINGLPNICGMEKKISSIVKKTDAVFLPDDGIDFSRIKSTFAIALHMQQPLIPAGGSDIHTAEIISNLKYMMDNQHIGDNHNAPVFQWCYKRMGEFISQLVSEGRQPRVMLDYSGCLLHGLRQMGLNDVIDSLRTITCEPEYKHCVEWLGCTWSHAVAPSTPAQDYRLHVRAWQHHFAAVFGLDALRRVKGFSPAEMAIPNHPDVCYEFVKTLKDCGYWWVMVQEHSVEDTETGYGVSRPHIPHLLVAKNSEGKTVSIIAIIKTQGSDTKLVAQMQPYYEAKGLSRVPLAGKNIPPLVVQIGDGENGGVMMNEFPDMFHQTVREYSGSETPSMNVTEYLEHIMAMGVKEDDLPTIQPVLQKRIWERFKDGSGQEKLNACIEDLSKEDNSFHMEGGSWTNNISWVKGYENVLGPINKVSAKFAEKVLNEGISTNEYRYQNALFYLLISQTSCYRYWGQGVWTDYAKEICRRAMEILRDDF